ncbi:MAG: SPFH domain-containing protein, partial [Deltaproteobacteria bacterium]|nr:SPFH domain-containing protein [Deltaproteobacteria bacterium]
MSDNKEDDSTLSENDKKASEIPKAKSKFLTLVKILIGLAVILLISSVFFLEYIRPNEFGIKIVRVGINRGVQTKIYQAGLHLVLPFGFQEISRLPKDIQILELTNYPEKAAKSSRHEKAAHIQTSDGFFVDVDVSILYRIEDPYKVFTTIGPGKLYEINGIIPKAEPVLKETLGELTTEEFYNSPLRVKKAEAAKETLNRELNPKGIR